MRGDKCALEFKQLVLLSSIGSTEIREQEAPGLSLHYRAVVSFPAATSDAGPQLFTHLTLDAESLR